MTFLGEERWGVIGLGSSARKIPSRLPSESAFGLHLPRQTPDSSDLRRRLGSAELALAGSVPAGGGLDRPYALSGYGGGPNRCLVKVPGSTPGKIPNPSSNLGKMKKWVVRYEEDAYDPTAVWRIATAANHKADMVQQQRGGFQKVVTGLKESMNRVENLLQRLANLQDGGAINLRPIDESRNVSVLIQPREMARRVDDLRQINPNSTQGVQLKSTPEGNSKLPSTGLSVVAIGWDQDPLPCSWASSTVNHQNPSQEPALDRQWLQNPKENLSQSHPQYQAKQWDSNPSNKRDLSVSTVDDDLSYSNNMKIEQMEQTKVKAKLCSVEYQHRWVPGKEILEQEVYGIDPYTHNLPKEIVPADLDWSIDDKAEEKKGVNESGDENKINKDIAVKTNFVMANVPDEAKFYLTQLYMVGRDDRWLWSTRLLWKPPPWPDFCAMGCDSVAQQGGYEVLVNFHSVKKYHISLDKAFELNDYCYSHQPPISLIKAEVCGLFGSVFCDFGPEITVLDVDGGDPHTGITASISNDNPALVSCDDDEADFHMRQGALLYNFDAQMLPKGYHCVSRRLMLEYSKFSSLDSDEPFAGKLNNPKHRNTYKLVYVHVLNYEAILWEKLPKFSMQQLYFVGLLWNLPPWPDLNFCEVNWMANGMDKGARAVLKKDVYNTVTGQSKIYSQLAKSKPFIVAGVENEIVSASSGTPSTDLIVCAVCRRSTSFRCKRCKGVKYCTFKCQIAHWRQGHKDECHSPSVDARPDHITEASSVKKGVEWNSSCEENVLARVEPAVKINKSVAAMPESSEEDCVVESLDGESKEMPFEKASNTAEASEDDHDNSRIKFSQLPGQAESVNCSMLPTSGTACKVHGAAVGENVSHIPAHNYNSQDDWSAQLESELEKPNKQAGTDNLKSLRCLPSMSAVDEVSSTRGGAYSAARNPSKRADNLSEISVRSENEGAVPYNLSTAKKAIRQQTAPKLVRNYPLELTLFPYELFVKLYNFDKVELHPFGPCSLGNSCYANAVLQCLAFTRPLTAYLLEGLHSRNCSKKEWCFLCEFEKLIAEGKRGKSPLSPTGILPHLRDIGSSFGPGREEDAHEFLRYAIDTMQSASMKEAKKNGDNQLAEETTLVKLIFGGYLRSKIKGTKCQVSSEQCERILDLTVEIDGDISTLEEALHWFTSTEILDGDNRYPCSRCKSYERAKKKLTISEAPNILTIALKRYQSGKLGKINKAIRFPEYLYLSSYMSTTDDRSPVYRLYAVVVPHDVTNAVTEAIEEMRVALGAAVILNYCPQAFSIQPGKYVKYIGRSTTHYILEHEMHLLLLILY